MQVGTAEIDSSEMALLVESPEVYSAHMVKSAGQQAVAAAESLGALRERLDNAIVGGRIACVVVFAALGIALTWLSLYYLPARIESQVAPNFKEHGERLAKIEQKVNDIDENQRRLLPSLLQEFLKKSAAGKSHNLEDRLLFAQALLNAATKQRVLSNAEEVSRLGQTLRELGAKNPDYRQLIWQTSTQLINYRSLLNSELYPAPPMPGATRRTIGIKADPGARFRVLNSIFQGVEQKLDGGTWEEVLFRNCLIKYDGGPVSLENVHFENCEFQIALTPKGEKLGEVLLASNAPTVQLP